MRMHSYMYTCACVCVCVLGFFPLLYPSFYIQHVYFRCTNIHIYPYLCEPSDKNSTSDGVIEGDSNQMEFRINLTKIDKYASRFAQRNSGDGSNSRRRRRDDTDNE